MFGVKHKFIATIIQTLLIIVLLGIVPSYADAAASSVVIQQLIAPSQDHLSVGAQNTLDCSASGGNALQYQYWVHKVGEPWQIIQPFGPSSKLTWSPTDSGDYEVGVWVKDASSVAPYDALLIKPYTITASAAVQPVAIDSLDSDKASAASGDSIVWSCHASGGKSLQYQYWVHKVGEPWQIVQPFGPSSKLTWSPTDSGDYEVGAWVKDASSVAPYDALLIKPYTITASAAVQPVAIDSLDSDKTSVASGNSVAWSCRARGGKSLQYLYWVHKVGEPWQIVQPFGPSNTLSYKFTSSGDYEVGVWVKDTSSVAPYDALLIKPYTVTASAAVQPVVITSLDSDNADAIIENVAWTCRANGGKILQYQYWLHKIGEPWQIVQPFGPSNTLSYKFTSSGDYEVGVWVKDTSSAAPYDAVMIKPYRVNTVQPISLTPNTEKTVPGETVVWSCDTIGGSTVKYQYWIHKINEPWQIVQPYGADKTFVWTPSVSGDYEIGVWVKDSASTAPYDRLLIKPYRVLTEIVTPLNIVSLATSDDRIYSKVPSLWTCTATGGKSLMYQYWVHKVGEPWQIEKTYDTSNLFNWIPPTTGNYEIGVWVKNTQSKSAYDSLLIVPCRVESRVNINHFRPSLASPISIGCKVTWDWNLSLIGSTQSEILSQLWIHKKGEPWEIISTYSLNNSYDWVPKSSGNYEIGLWVKEPGSSDPYDAIKVVEFTVTDAIPIKINSLTVDRAQIKLNSVPTQWVCDATGDYNYYEYWVHKLGEPWQLIRGYSDDSKLTWTPNSSGNYEMKVRVDSKFSCSEGKYSKELIKSFTVADSTLVIKSLKPNIMGKLYPYTVTTWTCEATSPDPLYYDFVFTKIGEPGKGFGVGSLRPNDCQAQINHNSYTSLGPGNYEVECSVSEGHPGTPYTDTIKTSFTIYPDDNPLVVEPLVSNLQSPQPTVSNVIWTCHASGSENLLYQFSVKKTGESIQIAQPYSSNNSFVWTPKLDPMFDSGYYQIFVNVKSAVEGDNRFGGTGKDFYISAVRLKSLKPTNEQTNYKLNSQINWQVTVDSTTLRKSDLEYAYYVKFENEEWKLIQGYSRYGSFSYTPTKSGHYEIEARAKMYFREDACYDSIRNEFNVN